MRAKGWRDKNDRIVRSHGFYYNIDHMSGSGPDYETVRKTCDCGGYHGEGRAVAGGKKRHVASPLKGRGRQKCVHCDERSIPGMKKGQGLCQKHWDEYAFGKQVSEVNALLK
jgi:hypothetical protein